MTGLKLFYLGRRFRDENTVFCNSMVRLRLARCSSWPLGRVHVERFPFTFDDSIPFISLSYCPLNSLTNENETNRQWIKNPSSVSINFIRQIRARWRNFSYEIKRNVSSKLIKSLTCIIGKMKKWRNNLFASKLRLCQFNSSWTFANVVLMVRRKRFIW